MFVYCVTAIKINYDSKGLGMEATQEHSIQTGELEKFGNKMAEVIATLAFLSHRSAIHEIKIDTYKYTYEILQKCVIFLKLSPRLIGSSIRCKKNTTHILFLTEIWLHGVESPCIVSISLDQN